VCIFVPQLTAKQMAPTNLIEQYKVNFANEIKLYGITEIFFIDGELYTTSYYDIPYSILDKFLTK
jgi:hypothetical protein